MQHLFDGSVHSFGLPIRLGVVRERKMDLCTQQCPEIPPHISCESHIAIIYNLPWQSKLPYDVGEKHCSYLPCIKSRLTNRARNELHKLGQMVYASKIVLCPKAEQGKEVMKSMLQDVNLDSGMGSGCS